MRNRGPSDADGVLVTDPTPAGLTLVSLNGPCTAAPGCSLLAGSSETATATFAIPPDYAGADPIVNLASVTSATPDPNTTRNTSRASSSLDTPVAAVSIAMTDNVTEVTAGLSTTYTITLTNDGPASALDTRVVDAFDPAAFASVQWQCVASGTSTCTASGSQAGDIDTLVKLDPGPANAIVITVQAQVRPDATGTVENAATVTIAAGTTDPTADNNHATDLDTIRSVADMSLVKTGPSIIVPGTTVDYTIVATNSGPSVARDFRLADLPEEGATPGIGLFRPDLIQSIQAPPDVTCADQFFPFPSTGQELFVPVCAIPVLAPSETRTITVRLRIPPDYPASLDPSAPTALSNIADAITIGADVDPDLDDLLSTTTATVAPEADIGATKIGPGAVVAGSLASYFIRVANAGPSRATNVVVEDPIPPGLISRAIDGPCAAFPCTIGVLDAGSEVNLRVDVGVPLAYAGPQTYVNIATARSDVSDPNPADNAGSVSTLVLEPRADLLLAKTGPASVVPGAELQYDMVVTKSGSSIAVDVLTVDALPAGTTFVSIATAGAATSCAAPPVGAVGILRCTTPLLQPGEEVRVHLVVKADADLRAGSVLSNVAVVSSPLPDYNNTNDRARVDTVVAAATDADLEITKSGAPDVAVVGADLTYTLAVHNRGPATANSVALTDVLPASLVLVSAAASQGSCTGPRCELGGLAAGATATVTLVATATAPGVAVNEATVTAAEPDPAVANNRVTHVTTVGRADQANLVVRILAVPNVLYAGQTSGYITTVTNRGPAPALNVHLDVQLPPGAVFVTNVNACTTSFPCDFETLQPGETRTVSTAFTVPAASATPGTLTSVATVSSDTPDADPTSNSDSVAQTVLASSDADLEVTVTDSPDAVTSGGALSYAVVVANHGPATVTGARVTNLVPADLTNVSVTSDQGACTGIGPIDCDLPELTAGSYVVIQILANAPIVVPTPNPMVTTATVTGSAPDPDSTNDTAVEPTTVLLGTDADLSIVKTGPGITALGQDVVYSIAVTNLGPGGAAAVSVADLTPPGLTFVSASAPCAGGFPCNLGTMAAGATTTIAVTFHVPTTYSAPSIVNVASVSATTLDPLPGNNTATVVTAIARRGTFRPGCDLNGDGIDDLVAGAGAGGGPHVRAFSLIAGAPVELASFYGDSAQSSGGVFVACGDVNSDGVDDIITGAGPGADPRVRALTLSGGTVVEVASFDAYGTEFKGGVRVATGDVDGDGTIDIITGAGPGGGPHVRVFSLAGGVPAEIASFYAYDPRFAGGVAVAGGDVNGDGVADIITGAGPGGGPHVRAFSLVGGLIEIASFYASRSGIRGRGVRGGRRPGRGQRGRHRHRRRTWRQSACPRVQAGRQPGRDCELLRVRPGIHRRCIRGSRRRGR